MNYINIKWQEGTDNYDGVNGAQINEVLYVVLDKVKELNEEFPSKENEMTMEKIEEAIMWQQKRKEDRERRNVEGLYKE